MHRRSTDALEREIGDWERIRQALPGDASLVARSFVDDQLQRLRYELSVRDRPKVWGRRKSDPRPTLLQLFP